MDCPNCGEPDMAFYPADPDLDEPSMYECYECGWTVDE